MSRRDVGLTARGVVLVWVGVVAVVAGTLIGVTVMVQLGGLLLLTPAAGWGLLVLEARVHGGGRLQVDRRVVPHPVTVGEPATVHVSVTAARPGRSRLDRLQVAERASRELSGGAPLRARVRRGADGIHLTYPVSPSRRGRWSVGPLQVRRRDVFGVAWWAGTIGEPRLVAVRPAVTWLATSTGQAPSDPERASAGARTAAADDAALRDYRIGDDLRRVHWPSSARRGVLMVRQDERSGRRPASVLLDLPVDAAAGEWSIRLAASVAVSLAQAGHHVRLLGGDVIGAAVDHHRADAGAGAVDSLLDQTVDLVMPESPGARESWLRAALETLRADAGGSELVVAVVGALEPRTLSLLARADDGTRGWAMVRADEHPGTTPSTDAERTVDQLRRAGWTACLVLPGEDVMVSWARLLGSDDRLAVAR